jgi:hypothetical protein
VSWPLDDPGKPIIGCPCHSPTLRPWIATTSPLSHVFVEAFWSPALDSRSKFTGKSSRYLNSIIYRFQRARTFLSQAGPRFSSRSSSS